MDYPEQRQKYLNVYSKYLNALQLNDQLITLVKRLSTNLWKDSDGNPQNPSNEAIKSYILLELTKTRESCAQVIQFLRDTNIPENAALADGLEGFNTSPGRHSFGYTIDIPVTPVLPTERKLPNTRNYSMIKKPRGKAIIINVVPNEVKFEAHRFYHIFEQLLFKPQLHFSLTTYQIIDLLKTIAGDLADRKRENRDEAVMVMIITHGQGEKIKGRDHPDCGNGNDIKDIMPIVDIVDIFADVEDTIKMFFFTCCRHVKNEDKAEPRKAKNSDKKAGTDTNTHTVVFYSSAEGYETKHDGFYTTAGMKLSESIAQYAHNESLSEIINRTNQAIKDEYHDGNRANVGYFAPENRQKALTHSVFFNPGWYDCKKVNEEN